jgi:dTDP-4-amino-4,6-dideoxygalactose transaminase
MDPIMENVQAAIALAAIDELPAWTAATERHAERLTQLLAGTPGLQTPVVPAGREHTYYQDCAYTPARDEVMRRAIRRGVAKPFTWMSAGVRVAHGETA